jgi:AcrR family transcriptional regulator
VSIGSLYQYFPSKESIIAELIEKKFSQEVALLELRLQESQNLSLEQLVRSYLTGVAQAQRQNPKLRKVLIEQVPRSGKLSELMNYQEKLASKIGEQLQKRSDIRKTNPEISAFILTHAVEAVLHAAGSRNQSYLENPQFLQECVELVCRYLAISAKVIERDIVF